MFWGTAAGVGVEVEPLAAAGCALLRALFTMWTVFMCLILYTLKASESFMMRPEYISRCLSAGISSKSAPASLVLRSNTVADSSIVIVCVLSLELFTLKVIWASLPVSALSAMAAQQGRAE